MPIGLFSSCYLDISSCEMFQALLLKYSSGWSSHVALLKWLGFLRVVVALMAKIPFCFLPSSKFACLQKLLIHVINEVQLPIKNVSSKLHSREINFY